MALLKYIITLQGDTHYETSSISVRIATVQGKPSFYIMSTYYEILGQSLWFAIESNEIKLEWAKLIYF
jgi:hypothetical protein